MRTNLKFLASLATLCAAFAAGPVIDIGSHRELFLDRFLIDSMTGSELRLQTPVEKEISVKFSEPWEGPFVGYVTVIRYGSRYSLYYRGVTEAAPGGKQETVTCYAESDDGIVMGMRRADLEGWQFHPESFMTGEGMALLRNWLRL